MKRETGQVDTMKSGQLCPQCYLTKSVFEVVVHKSILTQIHQLLLYVSNTKGYIDGSVAGLTSAKQLLKHFVWDKITRPATARRRATEMVWKTFALKITRDKARIWPWLACLFQVRSISCLFKVRSTTFISHKVYVKSFCKSQSPHKFVTCPSYW